MTPESTPPPESVDLFMPLMQSLFFIFLFVVILLAATFWIKRLGQARWNKENETSLVEVLERRAISPKVALYLVRVQDKHILVGESASGLTRLAELSTNESEGLN